MQKCRKHNKVIDKVRFEQAKNKIIGIERQRVGIGTLSEKTVHAILKNYYEPDEDKQEIPIENYVADIFSDNEIIEIQTRQFNKMREKLKTFLPLYPVTIVYPIPREKWLVWIDEETGEMSNRRKSPKKGNPYQAFIELYRIKMFLKNPNLRFRIVMIDMEEYKLLNGWSKDKKKGSTRYDRIPTELIEEIEIDSIRDYMQFVPYTLPEEFTSKEFAKEAHIPLKLSQTTLNILYDLKIVDRIGKKERTYLYKVLE
ncbi:MAG: hypothetical protein K6G30_11725 [Acetatifactor sp.]|nr:hypothetical protein [Acetatifactor sp.]